MGIFDFLKSNKNIITDNGTNFIYKNDGKGKLKEYFIKVNGVLNGEYLKYDESGKILSTDYYHDGHIITLDEKQRIDDNKRRIENNEKEKTLVEFKRNICKLIEIDKTIFDVASGNLIVQMTNVTLLDFSKKLSTLFQDYFEEEFIKIYLFYKRNYLIHKLISFKDDEINLNQTFTEYLNSEKINRNKEIRKIGVTERKIHFYVRGRGGFIRDVEFQNKRIISNVFLELKRINYNHNISTLITSLSLNSFNPIELVVITNQDCELIGLEIDGYITINNTINNTIKSISDELWLCYDDKETRVIENKIHQEILSICQQYKFNQGQILFNLENLNVQNLIKISEINNLSPNDLYEKGIEKVECKDYLGAIIEFTKAIEIDENYIDAFMQRGYSKAILKDYKGAVEDFNKTIELDIDCRIYSARGRSKKNLFDFDGALQDYKIAVEKFPEDDSCYFGRGELKYEIEDYLGAIEDFNKCIEIKPNRTMSFHKRGDCKLKIEDYKGAIEDYSIVVQNRQEKYGVDRPPSENASKLLESVYHNRGIARFKTREFNLAIEDLKKAIELDPDFDDAIQLLETLK